MSREKNWNTSWLIDYRWSFRELFDTFYIPITIQELRDGVMPQVEIQADIVDINCGLVSSNYRILSTRAVLEDEQGREVWSDLKFTAIDMSKSNDNTLARTTIRQVDLAVHGACPVENPEAYRYRVEVMLGTGQVLQIIPTL